MAVAHISRLELHRFRGFESLTWLPTSGLNVLLGGGDVGKSTILDAVALLLHPSNGYNLSDSDYWHRKVEDEFCIEAVMHLPESTGIHNSAIAWPWEWNGREAVLPDGGADDAPRDPVYRVRVRGTADLELVHEILQPDNSTTGFSVALRRGIGVVRLAGDDRSDRDLRLIQGGGLDRLLDDRALRAKLGRKVALDVMEADLSDEAQQRLTALDTSFGERALPKDLGLGFVGGPGLSINALVGLTSKKGDVPLPLISWGAGTRRLSALAISDALQDGSPITVVDEIERGLEPYRQRRVVQSLKEKASQSFVTTHSATAIGAASGATLWYVDSQGRIGNLPTDKVSGHQRKDPEAFLARMTIVAEGDTEVGFLQEILRIYVAENWLDHGIHVTNGGGNEAVLNLLEALSSGGIQFAGFADHEAANPNPGRWQTVRDRIGGLLLRWEVGCLEENVLPLFDAAQIEQIITDPLNKRTGQRRRSLADRLGLDGQYPSIDEIVAAAGDQLIPIVVQAATGYVPDHLRGDAEKRGVYKGHASQWFKSLSGGHELASKVIELGVWPKLQDRFEPMLNALRIVIEPPAVRG